MKIVSGVLIENNMLDLEALCYATHAPREIILEMIAYELITPEGDGIENWHFNAISLQRAKKAISFYRDLEINMSGIALILDLLDKIELLKNNH